MPGTMPTDREALTGCQVTATGSKNGIQRTSHEGIVQGKMQDNTECSGCCGGRNRTLKPPCLTLLRRLNESSDMIKSQRCCEARPLFLTPPNTTQPLTQPRPQALVRYWCFCVRNAVTRHPFPEHSILHPLPATGAQRLHLPHCCVDATAPASRS